MQSPWRRQRQAPGCGLRKKVTCTRSPDPAKGATIASMSRFAHGAVLICLLTTALPADSQPAATPQADDDCGCTPSAEAQAGHAIVATVESLPEPADRILLRHTEIPGLLRAGVDEFSIDAGVRKCLQAGQKIRVQAVPTEDGRWQVHAVSLLRTVPGP